MRHAAVAALLLGAAGTTSAQRPVVTVASAGLTTVRHTITLSVPAGRSTHRIPIGPAIVGSIQSATPGVRVVEVRREPRFTETEALRAAIGRTFEFVDWPPRPPAKLVAMDPERWEYPRPGQILIGRPGGILWPSDMAIPDTGLVVTLESDRPQGALTLDYELAGGNWAAIYDLRLGSRGTLSATAVLATGALELAQAETRLLAGDLGRQRPLPRLNVAVNAFEDASITSGATAAEFGVAQGGVIGVSSRLDGYLDGVPLAPNATPMLAGQIYLYQLPERVNFTPGREVAVPLLSPTPATALRRLSVPSGLPFRGGIEADGTELPVPVLVSYEVARPRGTPLGDLPLPGGVVSVQVVGSDGVPQLTGRSAIGHLAPGETLRVNVGAAFDLSATRLQTAYTVSDTNVFGHTKALDLSYRVVLRNAGDSSVNVTVHEARAGRWSVVESSHPAESRSSTVVAFAVPVPARGESVLTYRVRVTF